MKESTMGIQILRPLFVAACALLFVSGFTPSSLDSWSWVQPATAKPPKKKPKVLHLAKAKRLDHQTFSDISPTIKMVVRNNEYQSPYSATEEAYVRKVLRGAMDEFVFIRLDESFLGREVIIECPVSGFARWKWKGGRISCGGLGLTIHFSFEKLSVFDVKGPTWIFASADGESYLKLEAFKNFRPDGIMAVVPIARREPQNEAAGSAPLVNETNGETTRTQSSE